MLLLLAAALLRTPTAKQDNFPPDPIPYEFRGVWVATVDNIDWPSKRTLTRDQQKKEMLDMLDLAQRLHFNAIIFQVRPSADALYPSKLEPWSEYLTGKQGKSPGWDPLKFTIDEAHKRGLELHAWFNPYRAKHPAQKGPSALNHISKTHPELVKSYGPFLWMDPGEPTVQDQTLRVILDVVHRYDVDGVHIDDYFYPYREKDSKGQYIDFPDDRSWSRYHGPLSRGDWRRKNVDDFIDRLYGAIKKEKKWVKFGISPFGIYRPGLPPTIKANVDQYADLYADAQKWLNNGWCDYFSPQLYWKIDQTPQSFPVLLDWWRSQNTAHRHVWPGLYTSKLFDGSPTWSASELVNQIWLTRKRGRPLTGIPDPVGTIQFSMKALRLNSGGICEALLKGPFGNDVFVPPSPWLSDKPPEAPQVKTSNDGTVTWTGTGTRFGFTLLRKGGYGSWTATLAHSTKLPESADGIGVICFNRAGVPSNMGAALRPKS